MLESPLVEHRLPGDKSATNGAVVFTVSGRLAADNVSELSTLLAAEPAGRTLCWISRTSSLSIERHRPLPPGARGRGITLRNCPRYIREWIARDDEQT